MCTDAITAFEPKVPADCKKRLETCLLNEAVEENNLTQTHFLMTAVFGMNRVSVSKKVGPAQSVLPMTGQLDLKQTEALLLTRKLYLGWQSV